MARHENRLVAFLWLSSLPMKALPSRKNTAWISVKFGYSWLQ